MLILIRPSIVIQLVGSRGDVQPFVALGKVLKEKYGHRIRLATHPVFKELVEDNGLEFYSIGGDPAELMDFMVKNPSLMPGIESLFNGDIERRRQGVYDIMKACWKSCVEPSNVFRPSLPFVADAIIANPPSFAHVHCAEKLGIPLHLMFTMPWSPNGAFPHPLANIQYTNADQSITNYLSYVMVETVMWQGLGGVTNQFRGEILGLEPMSLGSAVGIANRLRIPFTYCWPRALLPKPPNWGHNISICGSFFLPPSSTYTPSADLSAFLKSGAPPIYIGFGSIVVSDPKALTKLVFEAIKKAGVRALVSKGWGGLGIYEDMPIPDNVFILDNIPHDWLFKHVSCVVHHGGAGTTAAGIAAGKPTVTVPFFGDQPFWGSIIAQAGAGPAPISYKILTADALTTAIIEALKPSTLRNAQALGAQIENENGSEAGAEEFHDQLLVDNLRCSLAPSRVAVWRVKGTNIRLSALAATVLGNQKVLSYEDLELYRPCEHITETGPRDPISGATMAAFGTVGEILTGAADLIVPIRTLKVSVPEDGVEETTIKSPARANSIKQEDSTGPIKDVPVFSGNLNESSPPPSTSGVFANFASKSGSIGKEAAITAGNGVAQMIGAALRSPMDVTLGLTHGFHNAPLIYSDRTVRPKDEITDLKSGLRAAGKGFGYGLYDGITGLVTQPYHGAREGGATGLLKGFGKGIGGLALKPSAAACGLPAYTFKGLYKQLQKLQGPDIVTSVAQTRLEQGEADLETSTAEERADIFDRWVAARAQDERERAVSGGERY